MRDFFSMKELLEAGVHLGHQSRYWNPKMKEYLYTKKDGIHIINLQLTLAKGRIALNFVKDRVSEGAKVLFVGTKKQISQIVEEYGKASKMFYIHHRWPGGLLTNFDTIKKQIHYLKQLEKMEIDGSLEALPKKEILKLGKKKEKLNMLLSGIKEMDTLPDIMFVLDTVKERIAITEAKKMQIPVIAVVDSNADPAQIDFPIPGNDDSIRSSMLMLRSMCDAIKAGEIDYARKEAENFSKQQDMEENTDNNATEQNIEADGTETNKENA